MLAVTLPALFSCSIFHCEVLVKLSLAMIFSLLEVELALLELELPVPAVEVEVFAAELEALADVALDVAFVGA